MAQKVFQNSLLQEANLPLPCLPFLPWFLPTLAACSCSSPTHAGYWRGGMGGLGSACFLATSVPGPYSWHNHANSCANKKGRAGEEWEQTAGGGKCSGWLKKPCFHL